ncbi:MAG TPA: carbon storage regulator CsrA [Tepidisphaeraceae bacterium]|jgi:cytosine deaminase|nr:carbon storage regulator CsrA [Tepidisphaeraceae bacterium]
MLVLARQRNQAIVIGDDIEVSIIDIRGDKVRVGVDAPRSVSVHRKEIYEAIRKENQQAAEIRPEDVAAVISSPQNPPMKLVKEDEGSDPFLRAAIEEAKKSLSHGGIPIGAILVREGKIIGRGHDRRIQRGDPMGLAELDCLTNCGMQKSYRDTLMYTTLMPGLVSAGAIVGAGICRVCVADAVNYPGGECKGIKSVQLLRDCGVEVMDLKDGECAEMMAKFRQEKPGIWEDQIDQKR